MNHEDRGRVEASAELLTQARRVLNKARLWLFLLGDTTAAYTIDHIINDMEAERRRWRRIARSSPSENNSQ